MRFAEIPAPAAPAFARVKRFTRKSATPLQQPAADLRVAPAGVRGNDVRGNGVHGGGVRGAAAQTPGDRSTGDRSTSDRSTGDRSRARRSKELTTFNIIMLLVVAALVFTAYISNIITVDRLSVAITDLERREQNLLRQREALRAEINILSSYTRIQREAVGLDLLHATQQPFSLAVPGLRDDAGASAGASEGASAGASTDGGARE